MNCLVNKEKGELKILFPQRVVSTNVGKLKENIFTKLNEIDDVSCFSTVHWVFEETSEIDSLGLNLLVSLLEWTQEHNIKVESHIQDDLVFKTLDAVRLTRKMTVHRVTP